MADHAMSIGTLRTDCTVLADPLHATALRGRLDRAVSARLPQLIAELAEPILDGHDGVIRLRRLQLDLTLAGPFDEGTLARLLAARIVAALRQALADARRELRVWKSHQAYMASYVESRLGYARAPDWAFPDFAALALLSPSEAAVEILRTRPEVLVALARNGAVDGMPERILTRLDDDGCVVLLAAALQPAHGRLESTLTRLIEELVAQPDFGRGAVSDQAPARAALVMIMRALATDPALELAVAARAAAVIAELARLARLHAEVAGGPLTGADLEGAAAALPTGRHSPFHAELIRAIGDREVRATLAALLPRLRERGSPGDSREPEIAEPEGRKRRMTVRSLHSPVAGLALLLPGIVAVAAHRHLGPEALRQAVLSALPEEAWRGARTDPLLAALFPADPREPVGDVPPVPAGAIAAIAPESRHLFTDRRGADGWGDLVLARFAGRLPGLRASSRGYLQRQFLIASGKLDMNDETITVALDGPPLAIVLQMAGLSGAQMAIPYLQNRVLMLTLRRVR